MSSTEKPLSLSCFLQNIIEGLRDLLVLKKNPENKPPLVDRSEQEIDEMKAFSGRISVEDLHFLFDLALKGERDQTLCHDSQLALDVLLLKLSQSPRLESLVPLNPFLEGSSPPSQSESFDKPVSSSTNPLPQNKSSSLESKTEDNSSRKQSLIIKNESRSWLDFIQFLKSKNSILGGNGSQFVSKENIWKLALCFMSLPLHL